MSSDPFPWRWVVAGGGVLAVVALGVVWLLSCIGGIMDQV